MLKIIYLSLAKYHRRMLPLGFCLSRFCPESSKKRSQLSVFPAGQRRDGAVRTFGVLVRRRLLYTLNISIAVIQFGSEFVGQNYHTYRTNIIFQLFWVQSFHAQSCI